MDYTNNPLGQPSNLHPNSHDFVELEEIYSHLDSAQSAGNLPPNAPPAGALNSQAEWGHLLQSNKDGALEVYELEIGHGHRIFTFVTWAR